jgi:hypothetical protein
MSSSGGRPGGFDGLFANTHIIFLILFAFCCNPVALILGIAGLIACKDPRAKQNALIVTIISAIVVFSGAVGQTVFRR